MQVGYVVPQFSDAFHLLIQVMNLTEVIQERWVFLSLASFAVPVLTDSCLFVCFAQGLGLLIAFSPQLPNITF